MSFVISLCTFFFLHRQIEQAEESLDVTKDELKRRLRPYIGRDNMDLSGIYASNKFIPKEKFYELVNSKGAADTAALLQPTETEFVFWLKNFGAIPALKVQIVTKYDQTRKPEVTKSDFNTTHSLIMPSEKKRHTFRVPFNWCTSATKPAPLHVTTHVKYSDETRTYQYSMHCVFYGRRFHVLSEDSTEITEEDA